jgi:hypothetical protein
LASARRSKSSFPRHSGPRGFIPSCCRTLNQRTPDGFFPAERELTAVRSILLADPARSTIEKSPDETVLGFLPSKGFPRLCGVRNVSFRIVHACTFGVTSLVVRDDGGGRVAQHTRRRRHRGERAMRRLRVKSAAVISSVNVLRAPVHARSAKVVVGRFVDLLASRAAHAEGTAGPPTPGTLSRPSARRCA